MNIVLLILNLIVVMTLLCARFARFASNIYIVLFYRCTENCNGTCDNGTCYQNETCIQGCLDGLYGLNCSIPCPENCQNFTCHRENGTCSIGCKDGFYGDSCEKRMYFIQTFTEGFCCVRFKTTPPSNSIYANIIMEMSRKVPVNPM